MTRIVERNAAPPLEVRWLGRVEYTVALAEQERLVDRRIEGEGQDMLLLLEHEPVYTLGRGADAGDLRGAPERLGVPVYRVGRGGGATFHGPGQLVAYPIVRLAAHGRDVHCYVRALEESLIATCAGLGVAAETRAGLPGVWVGGTKLASVGIGVRRGVAWHGVALNIDPDLDYFAQIVPCRLPALRVSSLARFGGTDLDVRAVGWRFAASLAKTLGYQIAPAVDAPRYPWGTRSAGVRGALA